MNFQLFLTRLDKLTQVIRAPRLLRALVFHRVLAGAEHRAIFFLVFKRWWISVPIAGNLP